MTSGGDRACNLNDGYRLFTRAEQVLEPLQREIRVVPTLQQKLHTTDIDCFVDLLEDLVEPQHVPVRGPHLAVERTEVAPCDAHVGVVDVAVDDVGNDAVCVFSCAHAISQATELVRRGVLIQLDRILPAQSLSVEDLLRDPVHAHSCHGAFARVPGA